MRLVFVRDLVVVVGNSEQLQAVTGARDLVKMERPELLDLLSVEADAGFFHNVVYVGGDRALREDLELLRTGGRPLPVLDLETPAGPNELAHAVLDLVRETVQWNTRADSPQAD